MPAARKTVCTAVDPIVVNVLAIGGTPTIESIAIENAFHPGRFHEVHNSPTAIDAFARRDGFASGDEMARFWVATHADLISDGMIRFRGVFIQWAPFGEAHELD